MFVKKLLVIILVLTPFFTFAQHSYVGVKKCKMCHKSKKAGQQFVIWQKTKHAKAYENLKTDKANQIAKEKGFTTPAVETPECLKCHATGYNVDASLLGKKFKVEDGVQCETCHGPGSDYKKKSIMKDKAKAVANGLKLYEKPEELCMTCHNAESPTYVDFKFDEYWNKIKHPVPTKK